jgi:type IX secretion system PorP/SprF family membrane protein
MKKLLITYCLLVLSATLMKAQDPQFTQFYANPLYLNPAFAGTSIQSRIVVASRVQWPSIPGAFQTYSVSYDQYFPTIKSGFGLDVYYDRAGSGGLSTTSAKGMYAYELKIKKNLFIRPAVEIGYFQRGIDLNRLTFGDQLNTGNPITSVPIDQQRKQFIDIGAGILLYSPSYWAGFKFGHINQPDQSLLNDKSPLPMMFSLHGGYKLRLKSSKSLNRDYILFALNYKSQKKFDQLDLGAYYEHNALTVGIWYRGLPVVYSKTTGIGRDAVAILFGYNLNGMNIGYSYDITISQIGLNTGGSHEITIVYEWANRNNKRHSRKRRIIPCAKF